MMTAKKTPRTDSNPYSFGSLFEGILEPEGSLEEETYILNALREPGQQDMVSNQARDTSDLSYVCRWSNKAFPLKLFIQPTYGFLFSPADLKILNDLIMTTLTHFRETALVPFQFQFVKEPDLADIIIHYNRSYTPVRRHCYRQTDASGRIRKAEVTLDIPPDLTAYRTKQVLHEEPTGGGRQHNFAAYRTTLALHLLHNFLQALGVYGYSENKLDTGSRDGSALLMLTDRDIKTLQLLYRCPVGITRQELLDCWQQYTQGVMMSA